MKALITLLLVSTSSVALARPATIRDHRDNAPIMSDGYVAPVQAAPAQVRDHRTPTVAPSLSITSSMTFAPDYNPMRFRMMRPVTLANDVTIMRMRNRDHRPLRIDIDSRHGGFKHLRFDRTDGRLHIDSIVVMYESGHSQTFTIDQTLSARMPSLTIDLDRRVVTGVYIYGMTHKGRAQFDVIGLRR